LNDWQITEWLARDPRLRGSSIVAYEDGEPAAAEIRRRGTHPKFVQVLIESRTLQPLGQRKYWPMDQAACEHDLPVAIHFGALGGWPRSTFASISGSPPSRLRSRRDEMTCFSSSTT
jgi:uncharacterized protein